VAGLCETFPTDLFTLFDSAERWASVYPSPDHFHTAKIRFEENERQVKNWHEITSSKPLLEQQMSGFSSLFVSDVRRPPAAGRNPIYRIDRAKSVGNLFSPLLVLTSQMGVLNHLPNVACISYTCAYCELKY
jgi:hypothetical protein